MNYLGKSFIDPFLDIVQSYGLIHAPVPDFVSEPTEEKLTQYITTLKTSTAQAEAEQKRLASEKQQRTAIVPYVALGGIALVGALMILRWK